MDNREMAKGREVFVTRLNPVGTAAVYSASLAKDTDTLGFAIALAGQWQAERQNILLQRIIALQTPSKVFETATYLI
jgi:hypothetical protein